MARKEPDIFEGIGKTIGGVGEFLWQVPGAIGEGLHATDRAMFPGYWQGRDYEQTIREQETMMNDWIILENQLRDPHVAPEAKKQLLMGFYKQHKPKIMEQLGNQAFVKPEKKKPLKQQAQEKMIGQLSPDELKQWGFGITPTKPKEPFDVFDFAENLGKIEEGPLAPGAKQALKRTAVSQTKGGLRRPGQDLMGFIQENAPLLQPSKPKQPTIDQYKAKRVAELQATDKTNTPEYQKLMGTYIKPDKKTEGFTLPTTAGADDPFFPEDTIYHYDQDNKKFVILKHPEKAKKRTPADIEKEINDIRQLTVPFQGEKPGLLQEMAQQRERQLIEEWAKASGKKVVDFPAKTETVDPWYRGPYEKEIEPARTEIWDVGTTPNPFQQEQKMATAERQGLATTRTAPSINDPQPSTPQEQVRVSQLRKWLIKFNQSSEGKGHILRAHALNRTHPKTMAALEGHGWETVKEVLIRIKYGATDEDIMGEEETTPNISPHTISPEIRDLLSSVDDESAKIILGWISQGLNDEQIFEIIEQTKY